MSKAGAPAPLAYVFCVEAGWLETQARLLVRSIRRWGGRLADAPIHAYCPRPGDPLSAETQAVFAEHGVTFNAEPLNHDFAFYPQGNKVHACAHAEAHLDAKVFAFLDTDTVVLNEPAQLLLWPWFTLGAQPVVSVSLRRNKKVERWDALYDRFGARRRIKVRTMQDGVPIRGYFNGGLIAFRRSAGLAQRWLETMRVVHAEQLLPAGGIQNLDQMALSVVAAGRGVRLRLFNYRYNYAIPRRALFRDRMREVPLDALVHIHYHRWFNRPGFLRELQPPLDVDSERLRWLEQYLPFTPTIDEPLHGSPERKGMMEARDDDPDADANADEEAAG